MAIAPTPHGSDLPTLTFLYHELRSSSSKYSYALTCQAFESQVALFANIRRSGGPGIWPEITFDDGHVSNYEHALPILKSYGMVAHFFITAGWIAQPGYMDWTQLRLLQESGHRIGAHGWTHILLTRCTPVQLQKELGAARQALEDKLGVAVCSMSLPGGRYNRRVLAACQAAGYTEIFTSIPRAEPQPQRLLTGRVNIRSGMDFSTIEQLLQPGNTALAKMTRVYHLKEAAKSLLGDRLYARLWARVNSQEPGEEPGTAP